MTTKNKKRTFMDDYPEVRNMLKNKVDRHQAYWSTFMEFATLAVWWTMVLVCLGTLIIDVISGWMYGIAIKLTAFILERTAHLNDNNPRVRIIKDRNDEDDYLIRHYMLIQDRKDFPFNVFLHKFMKGDEDDIHDHPWGFFHLILSGGYYEHVTANEDGVSLDKGLKRVWRGPGYWKIVGPSYKHRIELGDSKPWTIFIPFKRCRDWGFWIPNDGTPDCPEWEKIGHEEYLRKKNMNMNMNKED